MNPPIDIDGAWEHNKTKKEQQTKIQTDTQELENKTDLEKSKTLGRFFMKTIQNTEREEKRTYWFVAERRGRPRDEGMRINGNRQEDYQGETAMCM